MPSQNINSYYYPKYTTKLNYGQYFDLTLASDETSYDEEVVFSTDVIGLNDGNRLPISIQLDNSGNTLQSNITFGNYIPSNTLVSSNYYNPKNLDFSCYTAYTGICDVGLVGTDNGLFTGLTGQTLYYIKVNKGWTAEMVLKPRITDEYFINSTTQEYLNDKYPSNSGTFFYFGTRAENKFYHTVSGSPASDSGYTRNTNELTCIETCGCSDTGITNSDCIKVYPSSGFTTVHNTGCNCGCASTENVPLPETDPKFDVLSNAISLRFDGCALNPRIGIKYIKITGDCVTTGTCETTGVTFQTGYTITEVLSDPIYDICGLQCGDTDEERWVMISAVFERYTTIEECDLENLGGLNDLRTVTTQSSIDGQSYKLISPPETHPGSTPERKIHIVKFDRKWFDDLNYRLGTLKLYVNGYLFLVIEDFEEIIPRELNTEKEKQVGVPFNISFGGGTQGLHDHLIFSGCSLPNGPYTQDPELFPNNILSATTLSGLSTNILLEQNFGGTFMGGISQFRMYVEPLGSPQVQHNFRVLKNKFNLFDFWCPDCLVTNGYLPEGYVDEFYFE